MVLTYVMLMLPASILMVDITVPVTLAMREMVSIVQVCLINVCFYIIVFSSSLTANVLADSLCWFIAR